jgi:hypothetical protein
MIEKEEFKELFIIITIYIHWYLAPPTLATFKFNLSLVTMHTSINKFRFSPYYQIQWFYRIVVVGVLIHTRSVNFGPYISRTENPNDLRPILAS